MSSYKKLIGLKIEDRYCIDASDTKITFTSGEKSVTIEAVGDCCSYSWFEHIELPDTPFTILEVKDVDLGKLAHKDPRYDCLKKYSLKIKTDKGYGDIEMRNNSNGYYGGDYVVTYEGF
jgi:hypothetical protein